MPYLTDAQLTKALELWRRDFPEDVKKTLDRADKEVLGQFSPANSMASGRWFFLGKPVDWSLNPTADPEFTWLVNRFWHLVNFGRAWRLTGDDIYVKAFIDHVRGWKAQNPVDFSLDWKTATYFQRLGPWRLLETGLRSESLLQAWQLMKDSPLVDDAFRVDFEALLVDHADYLCRYLGDADINHAMMHMLGPLLIAWHLPDHPRSSWWLHVALERFELCLNRQVSPEGVHVELTPGYHNVSAELFARPWLVSRLHGASVRPVFTDRLARMARFTEASLRPDGKTVALGDWDHDGSSARAMAFLGACFEDDALTARGEPYEEILWKVGPEAWEKCRALVGTGRTPTETVAFPEAGYYVLRDSQAYVFFDAAGMGGPHGHADALSFEMVWNKSLLVADPGRYTYEEGDWRRWFKGTGAHAAVQIDGQDQTPYRSTQAWGEPEARAQVLAWRSSPEADYLVAEHDGYRRLDDPVSCQRRLLFLRERGIVVVADVVEARGDHGFVLRWPLARPEGVHLHQDRTGARADVTLAGAQTSARWSFSWAGGLVGQPRLAQEEGWIAFRYGLKDPSPVLALSGRFSGTAVLVSVIQCGDWAPRTADGQPVVVDWNQALGRLTLALPSGILDLGPDGWSSEAS